MKEEILIYGVGNFFSQFEKTINDKYEVVAFIDKKKEGWHSGKKIIHINEINDYKYKYIVIMLYDIQECLCVSRNLLMGGVDCEKILLGHSLYGYYSQRVNRISILSNGNMELMVGKINLQVRSKDEFNNVLEVLVNHVYHYYINNEKNDIVLDVGMNIGSASAYFINNEKTEKVFAYEPFGETFAVAKDNLKEYLLKSDKIEIFQYGISDENAERTVGFNVNMTCGQSTIGSVREYAYGRYMAMGLVDSENEKNEIVHVRKASEVFRPIMQKYPLCNIVLKMDCEGEEYGILENLHGEGILSDFAFIMMEWHYKGKEECLRYLREAGFSYWCNDESDDIGVIYAYK